MQNQISVTTPVYNRNEYIEKSAAGNIPNHKSDFVPAVKTAKNESSASDAVRKNTYQTDKKSERSPDDTHAKNKLQNMFPVTMQKKDTAIVANKYVQVEMSEIAKAEKFFPPVPITEIKAPQTPYKNVYIVQKDEQKNDIDQSKQTNILPEKSEFLRDENIKPIVQNMSKDNEMSYGIQK